MKKQLHALLPLPYEYNALEPYIDEETMRLHHDKHHLAYVNNLNSALEKYPELFGKSVQDLLKNLNGLPEDIRMAVRNNAGGHVNHAMFWEIMNPGGRKEPAGELAKEIKNAFGGFEEFKDAFNDAGVKRFGSGWVWLVRKKEGNLEIISTPNQDNPIIESHWPIMGNDVWEHAYYLKYRNMRVDYLKAWWNVVNWKEVNSRFTI